MGMACDINEALQEQKKNSPQLTKKPKKIPGRWERNTEKGSEGDRENQRGADEERRRECGEPRL